MIVCAGCDFWNPINPELGECRRRAPTVRSIDKDTATSFWPYTSKTDGCGDAQPKLHFNEEGNEDLG